MRRFSSNSTTVLEIRYGMPMRMSIENLEPSASFSGAFRESRTVPDPSIWACCEASLRMAKIRSGGAAMVRSTETFWFVSAMEQLRHREQFRIDRLELGDGVGQRHPHDLPRLEGDHRVE